MFFTRARENLNGSLKVTVDVTGLIQVFIIQTRNASFVGGWRFSGFCFFFPGLHIYEITP